MAFTICGKNASLQKEKCDYQVELCLRGAKVRQVIEHEVDLRDNALGILACQGKSFFRNIDEGHFPALPGQPDGVPPGSAGEVENVATGGKEGMNVFRERARQKRIMFEPGTGRGAILLVPAVELG